MQGACALIGVSPATLRRWSAAGDLQVFTTPGGHRRFARSTILGLLPASHQQRALDPFSQTPKHPTHLDHRRVTMACLGVAWLDGLEEHELVPLRAYGRQIAHSLLGFIDAKSAPARRTLLKNASEAATEYGRIAARGSAGLRETVEVFLRFRMLFLDELVRMDRYRQLDNDAATYLLVAQTQAIDQLLVALMRGHDTEMAKREPKTISR